MTYIRLTRTVGRGFCERGEDDRLVTCFSHKTWVESSGNLPRIGKGQCGVVYHHIILAKEGGRIGPIGGHGISDPLSRHDGIG